MPGTRIFRSRHVEQPTTDAHKYRHDPYNSCGMILYSEMPLKVASDRTRPIDAVIRAAPSPKPCNPPAYETILPTLTANPPSRANLPNTAGPRCTPETSTEVSSIVLPQETLHKDMAGKARFVTFPKVLPDKLPEPSTDKAKMVRLFLGQLPYEFTPEMMFWLASTFADGTVLYLVERIIKTERHYSKAGVLQTTRLPTGCFHAYVEEKDYEKLERFLHKRVLVDSTGVWIAETAEQFGDLAAYTTAMKANKTKRVKGYPYGSVVVQVATSSYDPDQLAQRAAEREASEAK
jgi:hypothetical protein